MNRVVESTTKLPATGYEATVSKTYNDAGLVMTSTDINGGVTSYSYDELSYPSNNTHLPQ
jgi:YD repeat-containing protein